MTDPDMLETAVGAATANAIRRRAAAQRQRVADGTIAAGDKYPGVVIRSPEAALATHVAGDLEAIAADLDGGAT